jgi:hypothetical protein
MILIKTRNDMCEGTTLKWEHLDLKSTSKVFFPITYEASIQTPAAPDEQRLIHAELGALLR